ncbi:hypothetical protein [Natronococcus pandeyae]|nr:hypothetical protein [Natronococcus pandeyae]
MAYETLECNECGESFTASPDAEAAKRGYCSPSCQLEADDAGA